MERIGQHLRSAREAQGISLSSVESATKIRTKLLQALEDGRYEMLPSRSYLKGMVRTYAGFLGVDVAQALRMLEEEIGPENNYDIRDIVKPIHRPTIITLRPILIVVLIVSVAALLVILQKEYSKFLQSSTLSDLRSLTSQEPSIAPSLPNQTGTRSSTTLEAASQPLATSSPTATATPVQEITLEARIIDRTWLRVIVDDRTIFEGILVDGDSRTWTAKDKITIRSGNAGGVEITVNGKKQGLMGSRGEVVDRTWTRP